MAAMLLQRDTVTGIPLASAPTGADAAAVVAALRAAPELGDVAKIQRLYSSSSKSCREGGSSWSGADNNGSASRIDHLSFKVIDL